MCGLLPSTESTGHLPVLCIWKGYIYSVTAHSHYFSDNLWSCSLKYVCICRVGRSVQYNREAEMMKINPT